MTKKYIAFTDNTLPVNGYVSADEGKIAKVVSESGTYKLKVVDAGTAAITWTDVTGKPFTSVGTGLTVTGGTLSADTQLHFEIFTTLPTASATYAQTVGLVLRSASETGNIYD
ncbi:MAG TPA: hypothetical protein O0X27_05185, partial [Methanocorpusculum sp.]|nr:hypothetical protein [Methanocorpusculum sp.]